MDWTRTLSRGMSGEDVRYVKNILLQQGMLHAATHDTFGDDTRRAVRQFQMNEGLPVSGTVDKATWELLVGMDTSVAAAAMEALVPPETGTDDGVKMEEEVTDTPLAAQTPEATAAPSAKALMLCTLALQRIGDIYVWGASGMTDLSDSAIRSKDDEASRAIRFRDSQYTAGVTGLMAHDCSGFISYLMRQADVWTSRRDCDGIWEYCTPVQRSELIAGDFLFRHESGNPSNKTHIGLYIGRGLVVHSKGRDVGVVVEGINKGGSGYWHLCGRCKLLYKALDEQATRLS